MAYSGKCACGEITFKFELDPMMHFMCHCTDCQVMFNGSFEGYAISEDELSVEGDLSTFTYSGGSGLSLHVKFCPKCSTKIYTCLLYTSPSPRDKRQSRMPSSA